jgi:hypothetical protein
MGATILDAALVYAERGWPVFPLRPPSNAPAIPSAHPKGDPLRGKCKGECGRDGHGFHDATAEVERIERWWATYPDANIGIRTGVACDVLDIDHDDYATGVIDLPECETAGGPVVRTGSGRFHLYFLPTGNGRKIKFSEHCDWLGAGGYVVAPPSTHRRGGCYSWYSSPDLPLTAAPAALLAVVAPPPEPDRPFRDLGPRVVAGNGWSASGLIAKMATAPERTRHKTLYWAARAIGGDVTNGEAPEAAALAALDQLAVAAERAGLDSHDVETTIRDGYAKGGN